MKRKRSFLCVLLSLCCLAVLVGCGGENVTPDVPTPDTQEQTPTPDSTPDAPSTDSAPEDVEMVRCDLCGGEFEAGNIFRNHICSGKTGVSEDVEMARCEICGGEFEVGNIFRNHICIGRPVEPYTVEISEDGALIYDSIGFWSTVVGAINEPGVYTIVAESEDRDGNPWGKLKSGAGWICLVPFPYRPFTADYALDSFVADFEFRAEESDYLTRIGIYANESMSDFSISLLSFDGTSYVVEKELYSLTPFDADETILAEVVFYGDMTAYGVSFTDGDGVFRSYALTVSGKDGSLVVTQYA
ncbi:MAG: hypothetical protein IJF15_00375 [Oscillospiraceae bacterium]|nr:hypothetical protein [Oscillospiraceae bacterium]